MNHGKLKPAIHYSLFTNHRGFTLIELLIVIAVLGLLAAGVFVALNVTGTLNKASLSKAKTFSASVENDLSIAQVGKWSFEEGSGDTAKDTSGYGNDGDLGGSDSSCPGGATCPTWKQASDCALGFGGCIKFSGGSYIAVPPKQFEYTGGDMTFSFWGNPEADGEFLSKPWNSSNQYNYRIGWSVTDKVWVCLGGACGFGGTTAESFSRDSWHHIVVVFASSKKGGIYVDGKLSAQWDPITTDWNPSLGNGEVSLTMGRTFPGAGGWLNGLMDEVTIYNQALTSYQTQQLYAQGLEKHQLARQVIKLSE